MDTGQILAVAAALLGAILGSFLNALSFRYRTGRSALRGRSRCMRCGHGLSAGDLVPVLSWVFLRGRCRYCGARIAAQYPLVELAGAVLGALCYLAYPAPLAFTYALFVCLVLLFVLVYDLRHRIIPWSASVLLALLSAAGLLSAHAPLFAWLAGPLLAAPLFLLSLVSAGRWMGWGDAPLELSLGWILGVWPGVSALYIAFISGALVGIGLMLARRGATMRSEVPFAPFLILGAWCVHFLHVDLFSNIAVLLW